MALDKLTIIDGGGLSTTSDYRVGVITATKFVGPIEGAITSTDATFTGNVTIGGTLTYEDVTNIDSVGLVTARDGIFVPDSKKLEFGNISGNPDFSIYSSPTYEQGIIDYKRSGTGRSLRIRSTNTQIENWNGLAPIAKFVGGVGVGHVELNYAGDKKFETTTKGIQVGTGVTFETNGQATFAGIVTSNTLRLPDATSGSLGRLQLGNGLDLSLHHDGNNSFLINNTGYLSIQSQDGVNGIFIARNAEVNLYFGPSVRLQTSSAGITVNKDLDVDGHTNLDNVSIAGVTTMGNGGTAVNITGDLSISHNIPKISLIDTDNNPDYVIKNQNGNFTIKDTTNNAVRLIIDTNGNTGIGEDAPSEKLQVKGDILLGSTGADTALKFEYNNHQFAKIVGNGRDSSGYGDIDFYTSTGSGVTNLTQKMTIRADGKVGFGTDSPDQTVHIHKGSAGSVSSTATSVLTLENSTTAVLQFLTPNNVSAQLRFGDPQDNGAGFIDYSHSANTMAFGANGPTRMQLDGNGHLGIDVASVNQLANSKMLTLRPTDGDGIRFIRPGDTNNSPSTHMDLTTSTSGSTYRNGGDAYLLRLNSYNNDLEFRSYLDGGTGGIIRLRTHDGSNGSIRYWQMDEKGVTTHRSRSTVVKTHEFTYTGGAGGGTLNVNLLSISGYSASSTAVVEIKYVGMYGLAGSYISQGIWLCSYRRANGGAAANALAQQTHNSGSNSSSNVTMAWVGDNLRLTVGAFTGFTVHVTATVYNATINVLV